jgi:hypothetical protein
MPQIRPFGAKHLKMPARMRQYRPVACFEANFSMNNARKPIEMSANSYQIHSANPLSNSASQGRSGTGSRDQ